MIEIMSHQLADKHLDELCNMRNQLCQYDVAIVDNDNDTVVIYDAHDVEQWAKSVGITYSQSDDVPDFPVNYWIDGTPSDTSFASERDALIDAFSRHHEQGA